MTESDRAAFAEADKAIHPVEKQWHYPKMTKYGYVPETKEAVGFVRKYVYVHPTTGNKVTCNTGVNADYWSAADGTGGYWSDLEPYLIKHS